MGTVLQDKLERSVVHVRSLPAASCLFVFPVRHLGNNRRVRHARRLANPFTMARLYHSSAFASCPACPNTCTLWDLIMATSDKVQGRNNIVYSINTRRKKKFIRPSRYNNIISSRLISCGSPKYILFVFLRYLEDKVIN